MEKKNIVCFNYYEDDFCNKRFASFKNMKLHWRAKHPESFQEFHEKTLPELLEKESLKEVMDGLYNECLIKTEVSPNLKKCSNAKK